MAENTSQEKTEQPTSKRLQDARKRGQVARSQELQTVLLLLSSASVFLIFGDSMLDGLKHALESALTFDDALRVDSTDLPLIFIEELGVMFSAIIPLLVVTVMANIIGSGVVGGWIFSREVLAPKLERISPLKGFARIFSVRSLVELVKAVGKFILVGVFVAVMLWSFVGPLRLLPQTNLNIALLQGSNMMLDVFLYASLSLVLVVLIDIPYQLWKHRKELMMTRQEVKDELKQSEGKPEVKAAIRARQREMAQRRMMDALEGADVVITNPVHYAVAVRYDSSRSNAPIVVAKGKDLLAAMIRERAQEKDIPLFPAPPLARAIYHSTPLDKAIPQSLYIAVAQVLAYVYLLKNTAKKQREDIPVPEISGVPADLADRG